MRGGRTTGAVWHVIATVAAAACILVTLSGTAYAALPGYNGWYWALGHDHTSNGVWPHYRGWYADSPAWHVAQDDLGAWGDPVYSLADGVVLEARNDVGGFGPGASAGGALVVKYRTADGIDFKALYGHVESIQVVPGQTVAAGQVLAVLNDYTPAHVHLGIHLGSAYPAKSAEQTQTGYVGIWMGHTHESVTSTSGVVTPIIYGWVDPVAFLRSHNPTVTPAAAMTAPTAPKRVRAKRAFTTRGYLAPKHRKRGRDVTVQAYRLESGNWVLRASVRAVNQDYRKRTRWTARIRLPRKGVYRLIARVAADSSHGAGFAERTVVAR
jgi:hypothetical protein